MPSYSAIIKKAYRLTLAFPSLWVFGLFAVGGFNLNFLHYENIPLRKIKLSLQLLDLGMYFQQHPGALAGASLLLLALTLGGLVLTNWSRIMLIFMGQSAIESGRTEFVRQAKKSLAPLWLVIKISLLTTGLMLLVAAVLFGPPWFLDIDPGLQALLWTIGGVIFVPLAFLISCINILTVMYAVIYRLPLGKALNLGTDCFVSRWTQILGLVMLLAVLYCASFALGVALIFAARLIFSQLFLASRLFNILPVSVIIGMLKLVSNVLLWVLLAGLSVFFNQAFLLLFLELNKPVQASPAIQPHVVPWPLT
ncbi:MAG TPA: hypothetical protein VHA30_01770 [Patescibacteria group bacterium]|nr:hypothetical protein [Patescibacteria group bacterium]